jgi:TolB-like protein/Flp pilus assembly protein TadD
MPINHARRGATHHVVRFDCFEADLDSSQLRKRGMKMKLRPQSFQLLMSLIEHPGEVVKRDTLQRLLWPGEVFVNFEKSLNTAMAQLRQVLGDSADRPRFIETLPKLGYRFIADVYRPPSAVAEAEPVRARLLVLPFVNLSGDPAQEYFSDAMTDEIITALAGFAPEELAVIARSTAMHYKRTHKDITQIGHELNVDYVVEGGVVRWSDHVNINVQLIQTGDHAHLFAKRYDAAMSDIFAVHDTIAQAVAARIPAVAERLRNGSTVGGRVRRKPTEDLVAYNEYIQGRHEIWKQTPEGHMAAKQHFEAALARDPEFALACVGLAELYWYIGFAGYAPSRETDRVGRFYALRAVEIDAKLAEAHAFLSYYPKQRYYEDKLCYYDWPAILKDLARARELNSDSQVVRLRYAIVLMILGHTDEAITELEQALESDPLSIDVHAWLGETLCFGRKYDQALEQALRLVELAPMRFLAHMVLGHAYLALERYEESIAALRKAVELSDGLPLALGWLGLSLGLGGHTAEARAVLDRLRALATQRYVLPTCFAWTHLGLGEIDDAFVWMERAIDAPDRMLRPIKTYPFLDPLRADPRFAALLHKMNLGP